MTSASQVVLPSNTQGMAQGEYAMSESSVITVTAASGSALLASDAALMPAAPDPMTTILLPDMFTAGPYRAGPYIVAGAGVREGFLEPRRIACPMRKERSPSEPEAVWKEKDMSGGRKVDAMVVILRTSGCSWAKTGSYKGEPFVKLYTSGSFLDPREIPVPVRERVLREFAGCERILFESRPEYITEDVLSGLPKNVTLALGMESCDPEVLRVSVNKGFDQDDTARAGAMAKEAGLSVRTYVLLKPPYLTERAAVEDAVASVRFAAPFSDEVSVNPVNVQNGTAVERLWKRGEYRSPWIWSLIEVLRTCAGCGPRIMSSPSGGGNQRGVHNCGSCDRRALDAVERFSFSQDVRDLDVTCDCFKKWKAYCAAETMLGTPADLDRALDADLAVR